MVREPSEEECCILYFWIIVFKKLNGHKMKTMKERLLLIFALIIFSSCRDENRDPIVTGMENKPLPTFNILLPDSITYFNTANLKVGKKVVLFYYSPSCPYCRAQMREIVNNINRFDGAPICVVTDAEFNAMKDFIKYFRLDKYSNIIAGRDTGYVVGKKYRIMSIPFTAFFDKDKKLRTAYSGWLTSKTLVKALQL